jgi:hypothetical protein
MEDKVKPTGKCFFRGVYLIFHRPIEVKQFPVVAAPVHGDPSVISGLNVKTATVFARFIGHWLLLVQHALHGLPPRPRSGS